jgi:urocanate hydratase
MLYVILTQHHEELIQEFRQELETYGRIYMYRFRPDYEMRARPIEEYPGKCEQAKAIMLMIQNNLDYAVAQHPHELITYGGNGAVFQNWAQYLLTMKYLSEMTDETLTMYSGHPMGLFPSHKEAPRVVVTNGMVILIILNRMIGKNECLRRITIRTNDSRSICT